MKIRDQEHQLHDYTGNVSRSAPNVTGSAHDARRGRPAKQGRPCSGWNSLARTELKIAAFVEEGLSNPQIAEKLQLSRRTVATHVSHILNKLDIHSRTEIAREAARVREAALVSKAQRATANNTKILRRKGRWVTPLVAGLLAAASRPLPVAERARYVEEYRSELWEIAHAGAGRRAQVAYAARQIQSAVRLRAALRAPARRGATP